MERIMSDHLNPENIILKTKQYEFADGLREVQLGLTFVLMGIIWAWFLFNPSWIGFYIKLGQHYGAWASWIANLLLFSIPALAALGLQRLMEYVRRRWLWRQSGMIKSSRIMVPTAITLLSGIVFIVVLITGLVLQPLLQTGDFYVWSLIMLAAGWSFGATLIGLGVRVKVFRYVLLGILVALASPAALMYQSSLTQPALLFSVWGAFLLVSGLIVLKRVWPEIKVDNYAG
jgi:hypothetical protein